MSNASFDVYAAKASFFDNQVRADWAKNAYDPKEQGKINRLLNVTGPLNGLRILEPGCGTGRLTVILAERVGAKGSIVAMDISSKMIAAAHKRLFGINNVTVCQGAVESKAVYFGTFDQIICHQVFPHFADPANALQILASLLNPCGLMVISHFISLAQINDVHRKAGTAVAKDMMPEADQMRTLCLKCKLAIETWLDDESGYLLSARKKAEPKTLPMI
ncbi:MAG: class I SAM-dependent methyltransferase [Desulfobacteraceae bacterium]|jgi:demethylmenaquinone methyltransferase/2-methoxy-6-polyprenyl-1,4-benzoquinol methylase